jgi:hypothetical protein
MGETGKSRRALESQSELESGTSDISVFFSKSESSVFLMIFDFKHDSNIFQKY